MRSYFVAQSRVGGLFDAEIAMLICDRTSAAIIAHTYGDVRRSLAQAGATNQAHVQIPLESEVDWSSINRSITSQDVSPSRTPSAQAAKNPDKSELQGV
jgi:hypothetical protein